MSPSVLSSIVHQLECRALKATRSPRYFMFGRCNVYCIRLCMQYKKCVGAKYCCSDKCLCLWQQLVWHRPPSRASLVVEPWHSVPDTLQLPQLHNIHVKPTHNTVCQHSPPPLSSSPPSLPSSILPDNCRQHYHHFRLITQVRFPNRG